MKLLATSPTPQQRIIIVDSFAGQCLPSSDAEAKLAAFSRAFETALKDAETPTPSGSHIADSAWHADEELPGVEIKVSEIKPCASDQQKKLFDAYTGPGALPGSGGKKGKDVKRCVPSRDCSMAQQAHRRSTS